MYTSCHINGNLELWNHLCFSLFFLLKISPLCRRPVCGYCFSPNSHFFPLNSFQVQMKIAKKKKEKITKKKRTLTHRYGRSRPSQAVITPG